MFLGVCAIVLLALVPLTGGRLSRLGAIRPRGLWLIVAALALQVLVISVWPTMPHDLAVAGHIVSYLMLGVVVFWNRKIPGMLLLGAGAGLNAFAITINGGTLPASARALRAAGIHENPGFDNSGVIAHPHLAFLGDIMVTPSWLPLRNMLSVGDLVLLVGAAVLVWRTTRVPKSSGDASPHDNETALGATTGVLVASEAWSAPMAECCSRVGSQELAK